MKWFLTCFAAGDEYVREMHHMVESFRIYHPDIPLVTGVMPQVGGGWQSRSNFKAEWLARVLRGHADLGSALWVDADARFRRAIVPPSDCRRSQ